MGSVCICTLIYYDKISTKQCHNIFRSQVFPFNRMVDFGFLSIFSVTVKLDITVLQYNWMPENSIFVHFTNQLSKTLFLGEVNVHRFSEWLKYLGRKSINTDFTRLLKPLLSICGFTGALR